MLRTFEIVDQTIVERGYEAGLPDQATLASATWLDAHDPSAEEREALAGFLAVELPDGDDVDSDCDGYDTARTSRCSDSDGFNPEHGLDPDFEPAETAQSDTRQKPKASTCMDDVE